jgi:predicted amidophosphoribosyltransferase
MHRTRQFSRRYNQATELARVLGRLTGLVVDPLLVNRGRNTKPQVGLSGDARRRNLAGALQPSPDISSRLRGRRVIIVDDVVTTGSTAKAVTRALRAGGVQQVDVISFARVVTGKDD